jgi:hypothetical protein
MRYTATLLLIAGLALLNTHTAKSQNTSGDETRQVQIDTSLLFKDITASTKIVRVNKKIQRLEEYKNDRSKAYDEEQLEQQRQNILEKYIEGLQQKKKTLEHN